MRKQLAALILTACAAASAWASPVTYGGVLESGGGADLSGQLSSATGSDRVTFTTAGAFEHRFKFEFGGQGLLNGWVMQVADLGKWGTEGIRFDSLYFLDSALNKIVGSDFVTDGFVQGSTQFTLASSDVVPVSGSFYMVVRGTAGAPDVQDGSFSYSGGLNLTPTLEVPEPSALALALAALLLAATATTRRRIR